jgi:hypothetical protein
MRCDVLEGFFVPFRGFFLYYFNLSVNLKIPFL